MVCAVSNTLCIYPTVDRTVLSDRRADDSVGFTFTTSLMLHILLPPPFRYPRTHPRRTPLYSKLLRFQSLRSEEAREETRTSLADAILGGFNVSEFCRDNIVIFNTFGLPVIDRNNGILTLYKNVFLVIITSCQDCR